jgi:uncharacterized protein YegL
MSAFKPPRDRSLAPEDMDFDDRENHAQRVPIVLMIDNSSSMSGKPIGLLNEALARMQDDLHNDVELRAKAHICLITFGHDGVTAWHGDGPAGRGVSPFVPASEFYAPRLQAGGVTPLVEAVELGMRLVAEEKEELKRRYLSHYRPVLWVMSDGQPTCADGKPSDEWRRLPPIIKREEQAKRFVFFTVSVGNIGAHGDEVLQALAPDAHLKIEGFDFRSALQLVSASAEAAAHDDPIDAIKRKVLELAQRQVQVEVARV